MFYLVITREFRYMEQLVVQFVLLRAKLTQKGKEMKYRGNNT